MKISLIGYGKMGRMIEQIAVGRGHEIVCRVDVDTQEAFGSAAFRSADVAIEFTAPQAAWGNVQKAFAAGLKVVSGSTGWFDAHREELAQLCTAAGGGHTLLWASNFSVGVAATRRVNRYLASVMRSLPDYRVRMEEVHHVHKLDAPSGTALTLAEEACAELGADWHAALGEVTRPDGTTEAPTTADDGHTLFIDARRVGEVPGTHTVAYTSEFDTIRLQHEAHTRAGFALGAVLAAEYCLSHQGLLSVDDVWAEVFKS